MMRARDGQHVNPVRFTGLGGCVGVTAAALLSLGIPALFPVVTGIAAVYCMVEARRGGGIAAAGFAAVNALLCGVALTFAAFAVQVSVNPLG